MSDPRWDTEVKGEGRNGGLAKCKCDRVLCREGGFLDEFDGLAEMSEAEA